jgi:hypothetical protein
MTMVNAPMNWRNRTARAFALSELLTLAAVFALVGSMFVVLTGESRRMATLSGSLANLRTYGAGAQSYAADYADRVWSFSWSGGQNMPTEYPDLRFASDSTAAAANQAVDIIRRRGERPNFPVAANWLPHPIYNSLVLADYLASKLPAPWAVSPADSVRLCWASNPQAFEAGACNPSPSGLAPRWPYSSSYELGPAWYSPDYAVGNQQTISQGSTHSVYQTPSGGALGGRRMTEVAFPARKAMVWDTHQRHFGARSPFFMMAEARVPVLCADGTVQVRATAAANRGFQPNSPTSLTSTTVVYSPLNYEPPIPSGNFASNPAYMRFTRSGLGGIDFDGDEVPVPR